MYDFAPEIYTIVLFCLLLCAYQQSQHPRNHWLCFYSRLYIYKRCALHTSGYTMLPLSRTGAHRTPGCRAAVYGYICELMIQSRNSCRAAGAGLIHTVAKSRSGFSRHLGNKKFGHWKKKSQHFSMLNFSTVQCHFLGVSVRFQGN